LARPGGRRVPAWARPSGRRPLGPPGSVSRPAAVIRSWGER
jgi:hypothetical protein